MRVETEAAVHRRKKRQAVRRSLAERFSLLPAAGVSPIVDIIRDVDTHDDRLNGLGQRAWPEISGYPPVFGNWIGEIAHTGGGSYIWTGFSWEPAILGG